MPIDNLDDALRVIDSILDGREALEFIAADQGWIATDQVAKFLYSNEDWLP